MANTSTPPRVTISMRVMRAGDGYRYLMRTVAAGDGIRDITEPLVRYYQEKGTPPGRWGGRGIVGFPSAAIRTGEAATEEHLRRFLGAGEDPGTGHQLGRPFRVFRSMSERIEHRVSRLPRSLGAEEHQVAARAIEDEERARERRRAVAGFDFTASAPKSVSVLWAVADSATQAAVLRVHHDALDEILRLIERDLAMTRVGAGGPRGAAAQVEVRGVCAVAFDHYDSRASDPQLHTHLVIGNRVQAQRDGKWRSLDGRPLHAAVVALSETYNALLADRLTATLGIEWEARMRGRDRTPAWELTAIPETLIDEFSQRSRDIDDRVADLIQEYVRVHRRRPSRVQVIRLRQQATLETRPHKDLRSLDELTSRWRTRATATLGEDASRWARDVLDRAGSPTMLRREDIRSADLDRAAFEVLAAVGERRSTWRRWNLWAQAARTTMPLRLANPQDRIAVIEDIVDRAEHGSLRLTPPELASSPLPFRRDDGTSVFREKAGTVYSSTALLEAEDRLLARAATSSGPRLSHAATWATAAGRTLSTEQRTAAVSIATSGRVLDVLVGPAGTGKTTTLGGLRTAWEAEHGTGSVVGIAPSSVAAEVLAADLGIATDNVAKWLFEHDLTPERIAERDRLTVLRANLRVHPWLARTWRHRLGEVSSVVAETMELSPVWQRRNPEPGLVAAITRRIRALDREIPAWTLRAGDLMIIDEASLVGTFALDRITAHAAEAGAKVLLAGDWAQLSAIESGGAFGMLVRDRADPPELEAVRRFQQDWERAASLSLRNGDKDMLHEYAEHGRIVGGDLDDMLDTAYRAWHADRAQGKATALIAETAEVVAALNERARADRILVDEVSADGVILADGSQAGRGDEILTRRNERRLRSGRAGWVKNGDRWTVLQHHRDGSLTVRRTGIHRGGMVRLPAEYVREDVELAYAVTAHRAQGLTLNSGHCVVHSTGMTRETLYVAMTRGRESNIAYVAIDQPHLEEHQRPAHDLTAADVLAAVLGHVGAELSAHETLTAEQEAATSVGQLAAEYETIAQEAQRDRFTRLVVDAGADPGRVEQSIAAETFGVLSAALRRAEAAGHHLNAIVPRIVQDRPLEDDDDIAAVLTHRLDHILQTAIPRGPSQFIAGLIPAVRGPVTAETRDALDQRADLIRARARALADRAIHQHDPWIGDLGAPPASPARRRDWLACATTIAAYRDRYQVTGPRAVDDRGSGDWTRLADRSRARLAAEHARTLTHTAPPDNPPEREPSTRVLEHGEP